LAQDSPLTVEAIPPQTQSLARIDKTRSGLAWAFFGLLAAECAFGAASFIVIDWINPSNELQYTRERIRLVTDWLELIISPTIALNGAAVAFYMGTQRP
jgi:hypothetical protein